MARAGREEGVIKCGRICAHLDLELTGGRGFTVSFLGLEG